MIDNFYPIIKFIQELPAWLGVIFLGIAYSLTVLLALRSSIIGRLAMILVLLAITIWEVQFFENIIVKTLICIEFFCSVLPFYKRDPKYSSGLKEFGFSVKKLFIPNVFTATFIGNLSKFIYYILFGLKVFSLFWFLGLLLVQLIALWSVLRSFILYQKSRSHDQQIIYSRTFSILTPFSAGYLIPHSIYSWATLAFSTIGILNRDYRTSYISTDYHKRTNSLENNSDNLVHSAFVVFAACTLYFETDIFRAIILLTLGSSLRLVFSELLRTFSKLNKTKRLVVISSPSFNKEHYSRLINYVAPSGGLLTNQIKDSSSSCNSYVAFFFPKYSSYYYRGKYLETSELLVSPLFTHVLLSDKIPNAQRLLAFKSGLNSVFGILEIHTARFSRGTQNEVQEIEVFSFLCDEVLQDIELSRDELKIKKVKSTVYDNGAIISNLARERLEVSGCFESLRLNIKFLEFLGDKERDLSESLLDLPFDFFVIHRQLYEIPSHSGRFAEMFHIYEMIMRYLSCLAKVQLGEEYPEKESVSMGATASELRSYCQMTFENSVFEDNLKQFLAFNELDSSSVKILISALRRYTPTGSKFNLKPSIAEVFDWITTLRNRTKGHGSTSKVDPLNVYALNKVLIEILIQFKVFNLMFSYFNEIRGYKCKIELKHGGLPHYEIVERQEFISQTFDTENTLKIHLNGMNNFKECTKWFQNIDGRIYLYDGIESSKNKIYWYNFLTSTRVAMTSSQ